jgi:hypothetical protein
MEGKDSVYHIDSGKGEDNGYDLNVCVPLKLMLKLIPIMWVLLGDRAFD